MPVTSALSSSLVAAGGRRREPAQPAHGAFRAVAADQVSRPDAQFARRTTDLADDMVRQFCYAGQLMSPEHSRTQPFGTLGQHGLGPVLGDFPAARVFAVQAGQVERQAGEVRSRLVLRLVEQRIEARARAGTRRSAC